MKNQPKRRVATYGSDAEPDAEKERAQGAPDHVANDENSVEPSASEPATPRESAGGAATTAPSGPLAFRDFVPRQLSGFGVFKIAEYESFDAAVAAANQWIVESAIEVVQLETVVLPNIWSKYEEGTLDASIGTSGGMTAHWHQFLRVWHRVGVAE